MIQKYFKLSKVIGALFISIAVTMNRDIKLNSISDLLECLFNNMGLFLFLVILAYIYLYYVKFKDKRQFVISLLCAIIFSTFMIFGYNLNKTNNLFLFETINLSYIIQYIILYVGYTLFFMALFQYICRIEEWFESRIVKKLNMSNIHMFLLSFTLIVLSRIPYLIVFYPGISTQDSYTQIAQGLGVTALQNHHPVFLTVFMGSIIKLGDFLFGTIANGVFLYAIVQMLLTSLILAYCISAIREYTGKLGFITILCFFALFPVIAIYSITLWKDILLSHVILLYCVLLFKALADRRLSLSRRNAILLYIVMVLLLILKNTGLYICVITLLALLIYIKNKRRTVVILLFSVILTNFLINGPIFKLLNIEKGNSREALSVIMQIYAKNVKEHGNQFTSKEKQIVNEVLPFQQLSKLYNPRLSDPVKNEFDIDGFKNNIGDHLSLLIELSFKYPITTMSAVFANNFGYWYPYNDYWIISRNNYTRGLKGTGIYYDEDFDKYNHKYMLSASTKYNKLFEGVRDIPIITNFFSIGLYFWFYIICCLYAVYKKRYDYILTFLPLFVVFLTCIVSPVYGEFRYAYPIILCAPIFITLSIKKDNEITH